MPREFSRSRRVGEQIRRDLAQLIRDRISDDRMAMVSITSVDVTRDFAHAKVYITILGDPAERAQMVASLNYAAPMLRHELGRSMHIRTVPRLQFIYDEVVERGAALHDLIDRTVAADAAKHSDSESDETESC